MNGVAPGIPVNGIATTAGAFALTGLQGEAVTVAATQRVAIYQITGNQTNSAAQPTVGYDSTALAATQLVGYPVILPKGKAPALVSAGGATAVYIQAEIMDA